MTEKLIDPDCRQSKHQACTGDGPCQCQCQCHDLWCVHVYGPDDLIAASTREAADQCAAEINEAFEAIRRPDDPCFPDLKAVVEPSPWDPAEHAQTLTEQPEVYEP